MRAEGGYGLTFLLDHVFDEALLIVALGNDVDEDVVLLPETVNLVVLVFNDGPLSMVGHAVFDKLLLRDVVRVCVRERRSQIVQHSESAAALLL